MDWGAILLQCQHGPFQSLFTGSRELLPLASWKAIPSTLVPVRTISGSQSRQRVGVGVDGIVGVMVGVSVRVGVEVGVGVGSS